MTKQTWRAERFRSADIRRSAHQRAAKSARKRRRELCSAINFTARAAEEALEEVFETDQQKITAEPSEVTKQTASKTKTTTFLNKTIDLAINILFICIVLSILEPTFKALFTGQWLAAVFYAITTTICF